jgi:penicillin-binding protein 1A
MHRAAHGHGGVYFYLSDDLPKITSLTDYHPSIITTVYSDDNRKIAEFYKERRIVVPLEKIPASIAAGLHRRRRCPFLQTPRVSIFSASFGPLLKISKPAPLSRAAAPSHSRSPNPSCLTPERSYERKIKEAILAYRIDKAFTKEEILYLYLNQIYLGHGAYGVEAAAENYFGKSVSELSLAECAILAGLPQAPSRYSPFRFPERAKQRQIYVLNRMLAEGFINNTEVTQAIDVKMDIKPRRNWYIEEVPIYTEHIRGMWKKNTAEGRPVHTGPKNLRGREHRNAKSRPTGIEKGLRELDRRLGYRGPEAHLAPEEIEQFNDELQNSLQENPLTDGSSTKGVVIDVNDKKAVPPFAWAMLGGRFPSRICAGHASPIRTLTIYQAKLKKRSARCSKTGDVILVRVVKKQKREICGTFPWIRFPMPKAPCCALKRKPAW